MAGAAHGAGRWTWASSHRGRCRGRWRSGRRRGGTRRRPRGAPSPTRSGAASSCRASTSPSSRLRRCCRLWQSGSGSGRRQWRTAASGERPLQERPSGRLWSRASPPSPPSPLSARSSCTWAPTTVQGRQRKDPSSCPSPQTPPRVQSGRPLPAVVPHPRGSRPPAAPQAARRTESTFHEVYLDFGWGAQRVHLCDPHYDGMCGRTNTLPEHPDGRFVLKTELGMQLFRTDTGQVVYPFPAYKQVRAGCCCPSGRAHAPTLDPPPSLPSHAVLSQVEVLSLHLQFWLESKLDLPSIITAGTIIQAVLRSQEDVWAEDSSGDQRLVKDEWLLLLDILGEEAEVSIFSVLDKLFLKGAIRAAG